MIQRISNTIVSRPTDNGRFPGGIHRFDTIDSTNNWSLEQIRLGRDPPFVCIADHQSSGRGRRGRRWVSPAGANVYLSLAWHFDSAGDRLGLLSLAQGIAVIRTLDRIGVRSAWLKWPNDVLIGADKIAGILVEARRVRTGGCDAVIGVGLNYRMPEDVSMQAGVRWTDVAHAVSGALPEKGLLVSILLDEAISACHRFALEPEAMLSDIERRIGVLKGRDVGLQLENGDRFTGTVLGVTPYGELRVCMNGEERVFNSADISLERVVHADD